MELISLRQHGDAQSLVPGTFGDGFDLAFAAVVAAFLLVGFQDEAFEVAVAIEDEITDLADVRRAFFCVRWMVRLVVRPAMRVTPG